MNQAQITENKIGEVTFRRQLTRQHLGQKNSFPNQPSGKEILSILKKRSRQTLKIFRTLKQAGLRISPFLEIGAEKGERASAICTHLKAKGAILDLSAESLASNRFFAPKLNFVFPQFAFCADAYHLPFQKNSLPFVFAFQTLHHFPDPQPIFAEIYRVLTPGGHFYFGEEPIKQVFNLRLWRRDYHLRHFEKILKKLLLLPFLSDLGRSETKYQVIETAFPLPVWQKSCQIFTESHLTIVPPKGPSAKISFQNGLWTSVNPFTKSLNLLTGAGISGLCRKQGQLPSLIQPLKNTLACPNCRRPLFLQKPLTCFHCRLQFPVQKNIYYLLKDNLNKKLYPSL